MIWSEIVFEEKKSKLSLYIFILVWLWNKQFEFAHVNHTQIGSFNQPVLSKQGNVSCSRKEQEPLIRAQTCDWPIPRSKVKGQLSSISCQWGSEILELLQT